MEEKLKILYEIIGPELHEVAWRYHYPLNPAVGVFCYLQALKEKGFKLDIKKESFDVEYDFVFKSGSLQHFNASLTYKEVLQGWNKFSPCSINTLYDAICMVFDKLGVDLDFYKNRYEHTEWFEFRHYERMKIRQKMEDFILPFFVKYQEKMFLTLPDLKISNLKKPELFHKVLEKFPMKLYENSIKNPAEHGPCSEHIPLHDWDDFDEDYHPHLGNMMDYFWGLYLLEFSKEKNYPFFHEYKDDEKPEEYNNGRILQLSAETKKLMELMCGRHTLKPINYKQDYKNEFALSKININ